MYVYIVYMHSHIHILYRICNYIAASSCLGAASGTNWPPMMAATPTAKPTLAAKASGNEVATPTRKITTRGREMMVFTCCWKAKITSS